MSGLKIGNGIELPIDTVTQSIAILARRGAGKTYTASVIVEETIGAQVPVVVLDPTGAWWGLRSSVDGEKPGLPVVIFGGDHGDVPLEETAGTVLADVVIEHPGAYVLDMSALPSKRAEQRFAGDFLERLYRAKKPESGPLLLVVDEADVFAPQRPGPEQTRTLGALESIVRRGRIKGLGDLLITQRAAVLNKNVLTQTEILVVMQTTGPQDRTAIKEWIEGNGSPEQRDGVLETLASLEQGEAWVWSPSFLRTLVRIRIRARKTFDSSRTPGTGEAAIAPTTFAKVDLEKLGARIAATVEKAKADDPKELRRRIAELERQIAARPTEQVERVVEKVVEVPVLDERLVQHLGFAIADMETASDRVDELGREILEALRSARQPQAPIPSAARVAEKPRGVPASPARGDSQSVAATPPLAEEARSIEGDVQLGKAERSILAALAQYPVPLTREQLAFLAGYHPRSSGFTNAMGALRSGGYVSKEWPASLTAEWGGEALPAVGDVLTMFESRFGKAERGILAEMLAAYPAAVDRQVLADTLGYHPRSSGFVNALGKLRGLGLVDGFKLDDGFARLAGLA